MFGHQGYNSVDFNPSSCKSYWLILPGFTVIQLPPPIPQGVQIIMRIFYVVYICDFPINYTTISEESNTQVNVPPNTIYVH
jgi:hypothetical protein